MGNLPEFVDLAEAKVQEINGARTLHLPLGSMADFDMGFTDYQWYQSFMEKAFILSPDSNTTPKPNP